MSFDSKGPPKSTVKYSSPASTLIPDFTGYPNLLVRQIREVGEWFGIETRNKYEVIEEGGRQVAYAAEQQKGFLGAVMRQFFGHWRSFSIKFFDSNRKEFMEAQHPFRFYFTTLQISSSDGVFLGSIEKRFSILTKRFDVINSKGQVIMEVASPFWKIWTFPFNVGDKTVAHVKKKWSGFFSEAFTDRDNFVVEYNHPTLSNEHRCLILAAAIFVDLRFFEKKGGNN